MLLLTPRTNTGDRLRLSVSPEDYKKVRRGKRWKAVVIDKITGNQYRLRDAGCGIPRCHCDAFVVEEITKEESHENLPR